MATYHEITYWVCACVIWFYSRKATHKKCCLSRSEMKTIADVAVSKCPLLFTVWMQLRLRSHQNFYEIFTRKQFLPTSAGNAQGAVCTSVGNVQAQLHFQDDQQRAFGISNISNCRCNDYTPCVVIDRMAWRSSPFFISLPDIEKMHVV